MNTVKRTLGLTLACIILVGMLHMPARAAAFTDSATIVNRESVETLVALNIINGKEDGSYFDPAATVTRAELTKMICVALGGGRAPQLGTYEPSYNDTASHWAADYIEYSTRLGLVSGRGGGIFDPNATVTGTECAKMLLVAIGYQAVDETFLGTAWSIAVNARAAEKNLYAGLEYSTPSDGLSRDNAARMVHNAMDASMVGYTYTLVTVDGVLITLAVASDVSPAQTILSSSYKATIRYGVLTGISGGNLNITADGRGGSVSAAYTKVNRDHSALLGQYVKVLSRADDEVLGVIATGEHNIVSTAVNAITNDSGKVKLGGFSYPLHNGTAGSVTTLVDGVHVGAKTSSYFVNVLSYDDVTFIDHNSDGNYEFAVVTTHTPAKVNYMTATEVIAGGISYSYEENNIADGVMKGDYVTVTANLFNSCQDIAKIEPVTGKINGYRSGTNAAYRIDDNWYLASSMLSGVALGDTAQFFAVNGIIYSAQMVESAALDHVVMAVAIESPTALVRHAKLLMSDGKTKIVNIDRESNGFVIPAHGALYTYTQTNYGSKFKTAATVGDNTYTNAPAVAASGGTVSTIGGTAILDTAVIFVYDAATSNGEVITGKQLKRLVLTTAISAVGISSYTTAVGGLNRIVMAAVAVGTDGVLPTVHDPADKFGLIVDSAWQISDDTITYKVWDGASVVTVKERNTAALAIRTRMSLVKYSAITAEGVINDVATAGERKGAVIGIIGDEVSFDGVNMKQLTADTIYMYYDSSAEKTAEIGKSSGKLVRADEIAGVPLENVKVVFDGNDVAFILIDVNNKLSDDTTYPVTLNETNANVTAVFWDVYGNAIASGTTLPAGTIVNVTITASGADSIEVVFSGAEHSASGLGAPYVTGTDIAMGASDVMTMTFVVSGTASITVQDAS